MRSYRERILQTMDAPQSMNSSIQAESLTSFFELVAPELTNHCDALYGAHVLQIMGKAAFVCASRYARCRIVMAKADNIEFVRSVALGEIINVRAQVVFKGTASLTVIVEIFADGVGVPGEQPAMSGRFMMVAVDDAGKPVPIQRECHQEGISAREAAQCAYL